MSEIKLSVRASQTQASPIRKLVGLANEAEKRGIKVYKVNIGQPDIPTPEPFIDELRNVKCKVIEYAPSEGLEETRKAYQEYYDRKDIKLELSNINITTGGSEAITFAYAAVTDPEDEVIVFEPFYTNYNGFGTIVGTKLVPLTCGIDREFRMPSKEEIKAKITPKTKAIMICNPNNPTGVVYTEEELRRVVELAVENDLFLIGDEVYSDFSFEKEHKSLLEFPEVADRVIVIDSISKKFSSCGARIGALISRNEELMQAVLRFAQARLSVATMEQLAAARVVGQAADYVLSVKEEYQKRRDVVYEELAKIEGALYAKPEGAFYNIVKLPIEDSDDFASWLLKEFEFEGSTVMLAPAAGFYATPGLGTDEVRLAYVLEAEKMRQAMEVLRMGLEAYKKR